MAFHPSTGGIGALGALNKASVSGVGEPMSTDALIANLIGMTPAERQQFASINANDPMKLSAAKYVDNQLKTQANQLVAQQNRMAPPPVNQQAVANMAGAPQLPQMAQGLPENTGIGALPAPNMKGYADGGIVAFGKGGYNYGAPGAPNQGLLPDRTGYEGMSLSEFLPAIGRDMYTGAINAHNSIGEGVLGQENWREFSRNRNDKPKEYGMGNEANRTLASKVEPPAEITRRTDSRFPNGEPPLTPVSAPVGQRGTPAPTGAALAPGAGAMSIADLQKAQASVMPKGPVADPYAAEHAKSAAELNAVNEEGVVNAQAQKEGLAGLLAPREQRIKAREDRLKYTDDQNLNMSLINAGLAMMQSRGQGLAGIAEGAGVGVKQYSEGLKLSEAARQKIEDAKDAFDELKFNQTNMTNKAVTDAKRTVAEGAIAMRNAGIASSEKATGLAHDDAKALFSNYVQSREAGLDRASRERTAAFSAQVQKEIAAMPGGQEKLFATLGGGDAKKGFAYFTKETNEGRGDQALLKAYIANPAMMDFLDPSTKTAFQQMLKAQLVPGMVSGAPSAGQVRAP
jgi:hypothetical protein